MTLINRSKFISNTLLRKAVAIQLLVVLVLMTVLIGPGISGINTVNAYRVANIPESPRDPVWNSIPATNLSLGSNELTGGHGRPDLTQANNIEVKAAYNASELFMRFRWRDARVDNIHSYWEFRDGAWIKHEKGNTDSSNILEQDRLYMAWPITDIAGRDGKTFAEVGCAASCHKVVASGPDKDKIVPMDAGQGQLNKCASCHLNSGTRPGTFAHQAGTNNCIDCHGDRSFNPTASYNDTPTPVVADHALPDGGSLDIWHWKSSNATIGMVDDQVVTGGKKRGNDTAPGIDFDNKHASFNAPARIWPSGQAPSLSYVATKRDFNNTMIALNALDPTKLADGVTNVPEGTIVKNKLANNADANPNSADIRTSLRRSGEYYEIVIRRKLNTGEAKDYQFADLQANHPFSIAVTDASETNHAGSALQNLKFLADTKAPVANLSVPAISTNVSSGLNFMVKWSASDNTVGSGVNNFDIKYRKAGTSTWLDWLSEEVDNNGVFGLSKQPLSIVAGQTFEFKARATDDAGNVGAYTAVRKTVVPLDDNTFSFQGSWKADNSVNHFRGSAKSTNVKGSFASERFTGKSFTLIGPKGPDMGKISIYVDGKLIKTIDQYSATNVYRSKLFTKSWTASGLHKIIIERAGTKNTASSGKRIAIDAIAIIK